MQVFKMKIGQTKILKQLIDDFKALNTATLQVI